jgi:hypothetical protein
VRESICYDGVDNDCNGLIDCTDPSCANRYCGALSRTCTAPGTCGFTCVGYGYQCTDGTSCCSQICSNGICAPVLDAGTVCAALGSACSLPTDCCTNTCVFDGGTSDSGICTPDPTFGDAWGCLADGGYSNVCAVYPSTPLVATCGDPCIRDVCRQDPGCCSSEWSFNCANEADRNCWRRCWPPW